jgi:hypothetical protein
MVTAERAREIARDSLKRATGFPVEYMHAVVINSIAADFIDQRIETLEAWRAEHRSIRTHWMEYGKSDDCRECVAIERELARLRKEREALTAGSRTIAE